VSSRAAVLFALVAVLWGIPYLFIKVAIDELSAPAIVFARVALGALVLLPMALRSGALDGLRGRLGALLALALLDFVAPFLLITAGESAISSSLAGILVASVPLMLAALAVRFDPEERVDGRRLAGLLVGLGGVVLLLGFEVSAQGDALLGAGAVLLASLSYAASALLYKRRFGDLPPIGVVAGALAVAALLLAVPAALAAPSELPSADVLGAVAGLGVLSTAAGFVCFYALMALVGPSRASVITYLAPAVAVAAGVLVLDEELTAGTVAGFALVLLGSWIATRRAAGREATASSPGS